MTRYQLAERSTWWVFTVLSVAVGLFSLRYGLPNVPYPLLDNFVTHRVALVTHAVFASIALLVGPWQFLAGSRARHPGLHRVGGRVYAAAVLISWIASVPIALNAETGTVASIGFLTLGVIWLHATAIGVVSAVRRRIDLHRRWMVRSFALTASAVTLRLLLGLSGALDLPFEDTYPAIAWLCWIPNLVAAELYLAARSNRGSGTSAVRAGAFTRDGQSTSSSRSRGKLHG